MMFQFAIVRLLLIVHKKPMSETTPELTAPPSHRELPVGKSIRSTDGHLIQESRPASEPPLAHERARMMADERKRARETDTNPNPQVVIKTVPEYNRPVPITDNIENQKYADAMAEQMSPEHKPVHIKVIPLTSDFESDLQEKSRVKLNKIYNRLLQSSWNFTDERINQVTDEILSATDESGDKPQIDPNEQYKIRKSIRVRMEQLRPMVRAAYDIDAHIHRRIAEGTITADALHGYIDTALQTYIDERHLTLTAEQLELLKNKISNGLEGYQAAAIKKQIRNQPVQSAQPESTPVLHQEEPLIPALTQESEILVDALSKTTIAKFRAGENIDDIITQQISHYENVNQAIPADQKPGIIQRLKEKAHETKDQNQQPQKLSFFQRLKGFFSR